MDATYSYSMRTFAPAEASSLAMLAFYEAYNQWADYVNKAQYGIWALPLGHGCCQVRNVFFCMYKIHKL